VGIQAGCSHCDYVRSFALDLRGMFYRCPRCKEGVIAVGGPAAAGLDMPPTSGSTQGSGSAELRVKPPEPPRKKQDEIEAAIEKELSKPRAGKVKKVLIECGLCGHHVAIMPEFFGKTVRCPECRGASAFTESTLEPVKEEILGRIALDSHERRMLDRPVPPPVPGPPPLRNRRRRYLIIAIAAAALLLVLVLILRLR
jgi:hypothetical protein